MNEDQVRSLLSLVDAPQVPSLATCDSVKSAMFAELDRCEDAKLPPVVVELDSSAVGRGSLRPSAFLGVAVSLALIVFAVGFSRRAEVVDTVPAASSPGYLHGCVNFQQVSSLDGEPWFRVLPALTPGGTTSEYLDGLAVAIERIGATSATTGAAAELDAVLRLFRSDAEDLDLTDLVKALNSARDQLALTTGVGCLDNRPRTAP